MQDMRKYVPYHGTEWTELVEQGWIMLYILGGEFLCPKVAVMEELK